MRNITCQATRHALAAGLALGLLATAGCNRGPATVDAAADNARVDASASNVPAAVPPGGQSGGAGSNPLLVATAGGPAPYLANSAGSALYAVAGDTDGSKCADECTRAWPPMLVEDALPSESPGVDATMVGVVQRADGSSQVTYNGHPLYRYGADAGAGQTAGHGVSDKWGNWSLIGPQGQPVVAAH